jgi:CheY-like chemotaxis protein
MPGMNGTEAMQHIRDDKGINCDTPFICLTADAISGAKERYMEAGFIDYLTKPIDYTALEKMLITYLPDSKVVINKNSENKAENNTSWPKTLPDEYDLLSKAGIDSSAGIRFCNNDWEFYTTILKDYVTSFNERSADLQRFYESKDWKDYCITVHALKSTSKTIGATDLSKRAELLEKASNEADSDYISSEHDTMERIYKEVTDAIISVFPDFNQGTSNDDDILEFMPDND